ncbi:MAG: glutamyl-tRNA amidotransferase [Bdellovibrionaceae bacterium]|nr:glutamyl-tRNA amidotransferase [Pseudobdellovibrionaceae bacterium]|tara:strand:+ start:23827 stop:24279 length:453 start_codon:yes stop_codon:yes gene_type:complete
MSLREQIMSDVKTAMKAKEADRLQALRMVQSAIKNKEIEVRPNDISEKDVMDVLKKLAKQRKDSIEQYTNAGRKDLADKEEAELDIINAYLPEQMSEEKVKEVVEKVVADMGAAGDMKQMGAVMKAVIDATSGAADNKVVSQLVRAKLSN